MNLKQRAKAGDRAALEALFHQFLPADEIIEDAAFLGQRGVLGFGTYSFAAVTDRRVASLQLTMLGQVVYRDGYHEHINSSIVVQPSRSHEFAAVTVGLAAWLWVLYQLVQLRVDGDELPFKRLSIGGGILNHLLVPIIALWVAAAVFAAPTVARVLYRFSKSGLVLHVRNGIPVYCFTDRARMGFANRLSSVATIARERRVPARLNGGDLPPPVAVNIDEILEAPASRLRRWLLVLQNEQTFARTLGGIVSTLAIARCIAAPTHLPVEEHAVWSATILQFLLPSAAAYLAGITLALAATRRARAIATGVVVGIGLAVGLQSLIALAYHPTDTVELGTGYGVAQGLGIALAVIVIGGWLASPTPVRNMASDETGAGSTFASASMVIGSFLVLSGSLLPWRTQVSRTVFWNWGIASTQPMVADSGRTHLYGTAFIAVFVVGTFLSLWLPLAALAQRHRHATPSVLAGWSLTIGLMVLTMQIEQNGLTRGFLMMEAGTVVTLLGSVAILAGAAIKRSARARLPQLAAWPPPNATSAD